MFHNWCFLVMLISSSLGLAACAGVDTQSEPAPTPVVVSAAEPTSSTKSTNTPLPTETAVPTVTLTPIPTETPQPSATPEPTASPTPISYMLEASIFHDLNGNETQDGEEPFISGVTISSSGLSCVSEIDGKCELGLLQSGTHQLRIFTARSSIDRPSYLFFNQDVFGVSEGLAVDIKQDTTVDIALGQGPLPLPVIASMGYGGIFNGFMTEAAPNHDGLDLWIDGQDEQPIIANIDGSIESISSDCNHVTLLVRKKDLEFNVGLGHLTRVVVKPGQQVKKGEVIGYIDPSLYNSVNRQPGTITVACTTQPHLHYNVYGPSGSRQDSWHFRDPALFAPDRGNPIPLFNTAEEFESYSKN